MVLFKYFNRKRYFFTVFLGLVLFICIPSISLAETIFEGWYQVLVAGSGGSPQHIGYYAQRFEFKDKKFYSTYYLRTSNANGDIIESASSESTDKFSPLKMDFNTIVTPKTDNQTRIRKITATFKDNKMTGSITDGNSAKPISKALEPGTFISNFLVYLMLSKGMKEGTKFTYSAVAEEDGEVYSGQALIKPKETHRGMPAYKVLIVFQDSQFYSFVTQTGEILGTESPTQGIATRLVMTSKEAIGSLPFEEKHFKSLFGGVPKGEKNVLHKK